MNTLYSREVGAQSAVMASAIAVDLGSNPLSHHIPPLQAPLDRLPAASREVGACGAEEPPAAYKISTADDIDEKAVSISGRGGR